MSGYAIAQELDAELALYAEAVSQLRRSGRALAQATRDYKRALALEMARLEAQGKAKTTMRDLARGDEDVCELAFRRDLAEAEYKADLEVINMRKRNVDVLREQYAREWSASGVA